ncbi:MAG: hypothetical protein KDE51_27135, partial [Anaerolineales bacterium]|nr:hypothetical protein [Anaerolineales bacterium]
MPRRIGSLLFAVTSALFTLLVLLSFARPSQAADYTVAGTCGDTIQECIDFATAGDTIIIPNGLYKENIVLDRAVSLRGESITGTMLNVGGEGRVLLITGTAVLSDTVIENLSILNGDVSDANVCSDQFDVSNCGGGVLIAGEASPTLRRVTIQANRAYYGGGIYVTRSAGVTLENVTLLDNEATLAGGGGVFYGATTILSSRFESNESGSSGGGASFSATFPNYPKFPVLISDTVFVDNTAVCTSAFCFLNGGGANIFELDATIINSRFENNVCSSGTGGCTGGGLA